MRVLQFFLLLASSHHHPSMNYHYISLLLLVVLSAYSESLQYAKPPPIGVTVYPDCSSAQLGILAPVLPQNEVYRPPPQNEVYKNPPQNEVYRIDLNQNESVLSQLGVFENFIPQNEVLKFVLSQTEVNRTVLPQNDVFKFVAVNCQSFNGVKIIIKFVLNFGVEKFKNLTLALIHGPEKLAWSTIILLESLQHVLKMYTWSLSENQASVQFKCRLVALMLKQSLFRKHDFAVYVHRIYHDYQSVYFWHLQNFPHYKNNFHTHIKEDHSKESNRFHFYGGGKALIFSSDELHPYVSPDLNEQQYQFRQGVKKDNKQSLHLNDGDVLCSVPLNILAPKLTLKTAKELANLHDMYMPSKILLKNAQILLEDHKCETCEDIFAVFRPYNVVSNVERQQTWYQKNKEKCAKYNKNRSSKPEYQESHKKSSQNHYQSKKDVKFPPDPPSAK